MPQAVQGLSLRPAAHRQQQCRKSFRAALAGRAGTGQVSQRAGRRLLPARPQRTDPNANVKMGKSLSASLTVSAVISFALLALYKFTTWFLQGAVNLEDFYRTIFVLPQREGGLAFIQPAQYGYFAVMALIST